MSFRYTSDALSVAIAPPTPRLASREANDRTARHVAMELRIAKAEDCDGSEAERIKELSDTIDRLVGQWIHDRFLWPASIATIAAENSVRRTK